MCTAIFCKGERAYFGRNLDLEQVFHERIVTMPRRYVIPFRHSQAIDFHYAMIGMATVINRFPLYYDATNERGLSMAALNFPDNAFYCGYTSYKDNITPFEFIPWILGQCSSTREARLLIEQLNLIGTNFSENIPLTPLHWIISDKEGSIVIEPLKSGIAVYDNPFNVLTNNPPFEYHRTNVNNYMNLSSEAIKNELNVRLPLKNYSLGMGALGLPGDFSSASRFIRALFVKENSDFNTDDLSCVNHFFHILNSVAMPKGCVGVNEGFEYTRYSSCTNTDTCVYHYTTYNNLSVRSVRMYDSDIDSAELYTYEIEGLE